MHTQGVRTYGGYVAQVTDYTEPVRLGAKLLDDKLGPEVTDATDLERLSMGNPRDCILGQAGNAKPGSWDKPLKRMIKKLGLDFGQLNIYGFDVPGLNSSADEYRELTKAWKNFLKERRAANAAEQERDSGES